MMHRRSRDRRDPALLLVISRGKLLKCTPQSHHHNRKKHPQESMRFHPDAGCAAQAKARRLELVKALGEHIQRHLAHIGISRRCAHANTFSACDARQRRIRETCENQALSVKAVISTGLELRDRMSIHAGHAIEVREWYFTRICRTKCAVVEL